MSCPQHTEVYIRGVGWVKKSDLAEAVRSDKPLPVTSKAYNRELKSRSNAVHATQSAHYNQMAKDAGISGVRFDAQGNCYFSCRRARNQWMKHTGRMDMDGGYGDHTGR